MRHDLFTTLIQITDVTSLPYHKSFPTLQDLATYCKNGHSENQSILKPLLSGILDLGEQYRKFIKYKHRLKIEKIGINVNKQPENYYSNCILSGVFFVNITKGEMIFKHPGFSNIENAWSVDDFEEKTIYNSTSCKILPNPNALIIFPGWLMHSIVPYNSNEETITISFNLINDRSN